MILFIAVFVFIVLILSFNLSCWYR